MSAPSPVFGRGGDAAQSAEEESRSSGGGGFAKIHYLPPIGKDKTIALRYLLDSPQWYYAKAHPSAPTRKVKPADWPEKSKFPESMPAVCRYDDAFQAKYDKSGGLISPATYTDCYICDARLENQWGRECKPVVRVWTLAVIRDEVLGTAEMVATGRITQDQVGKRVGFKDAMREVEVPVRDGEGKVVKDGDQIRTETVIEPAIVVVNKPVSNYFGGLQSCYGIYGTVCDRDFVVKQTGEKKDVEFVHIPLPQTLTLAPGTESWARYEEAIEKQGIDISALLQGNSSDDFYARFFDPNKEPAPRGGDKVAQPASGAPPAQQAAAPTNEPDPDRLAAMRARVRGAAASQTQEQPAPAPAAAPAAAMADFDA